MGKQELQTFTEACHAFVASFDDILHAGNENFGPESKSWIDAMEKHAALLLDHVDELDRERKRVAPVTSLLTDKRNVSRATMSSTCIAVSVDALSAIL